MKAELEIKDFLKSINEFRTPEQQPQGVQVVERVGLVLNDVPDSFWPIGVLVWRRCCSMNRTGGLITDSPYGDNASTWTRGHATIEVFP